MKRLLLVVVLVNAALLGLAVSSIDQSKRRYEAQAVTTTHNLSHVLAGHIADTVSRIDLTVLTVVDEVEQQLASPEGINPVKLTAFINRHYAMLPALDGLRVVNAEGENAYGIGIKPGLRSSVADRPYFQRLRSDPKAGLVISDPVIGRVSKKWSIILARRVNQPDGSFGGLVYGTINLEQFAATFASVDVGKLGVVTLRDEDLALVARTPVPKDFDQVVGTKNCSPELKKLVAAHLDEGSDRTNQGFDAVARRFSYKKVSHAPFYLIVGLAEDEYLAAWRNERDRVMLFMVIFVLGSILGSLLIYRSWLRRSVVTEALAQSAERLALATRAGGVGVWDYDPVHNTLVWDDQMYRLYGVAEDRFVGAYACWHQGLHPDDKARGDAEIQQALRGEKDFDTEFRVVWPNGEIRNIRAIAVVQRDAAGRALRMIGTNWDVTAVKQAEENLRQSNVELVAATAHANEMVVRAEMASIAKGEFLANMSHEIRTPMNGIIGMTGLLLDTPLDAQQRRYAEAVRSSGKTLLSLINDILDFSKIEAGKLELERIEFDLTAVLEEFGDMLALRAQDKGLEFICAATPEVPTLLCGDPGRVRQVLINLAGNAIKFTQQGEVVVRACVAEQTDESVVVRFSVCDTGIGIPADKQEMLFDKFTQVDASITRQYGGTGLGLAISKQLAGLLGGEIGVISAPGHGAEFWFTARFGRVHSGTAPSGPRLDDLRGVRMLVVDDNATHREVLTTQLHSWGVRVDEAPDAATALRILRRACDVADPFVTVIVDMQMPGMDGAELGRTIKADATLNPLRLILLTSLGLTGVAQSLAEVGFAACLTKPTHKLDLYRSLLSAPQAVAVELSAAPSTSQSAPRSREGVRVLLAEDNFINQQVASAILAKLGVSVDIAENGEEVIKALAARPYDLVFMDVQMPGMDGLTATRLLRSPASAVRNRAIPVVAMTANAMQGDREMCLAAGMDDYVSKPVEPAMLDAMLVKWLPATPSR